jgi:polyferredoxin
VKFDLEKYLIPGLSFLVTSFILGIVHLIIQPPILLLERFAPGLGWLEIILLASWAAFLTGKMQDPNKVALWRKTSWLVFSALFFSQLLLGIAVEEKFLMTGKLHLPVPAMILSGPIYRLQISFMPILFLSTIVLTGPAWCSQLCYFGAFDNWAASGRSLRNKPLQKKMRYKHFILLTTIAVTVLLRLFNVSAIYAAISGIVFGIAGLVIILLFSLKRNKMVHCIIFCPIGTITSYLKFLSPFRMSISDNCTTCLACTLKCRYDALNLENIKTRKPGITCTYCGDCLSACNENAIGYRFLWLKEESARNLYLILTISVYAAFMGLGRI